MRPETVVPIVGKRAAGTPPAMSRSFAVVMCSCAPLGSGDDAGGELGEACLVVGDVAGAASVVGRLAGSEIFAIPAVGAGNRRHRTPQCRCLFHAEFGEELNGGVHALECRGGDRSIESFRPFPRFVVGDGPVEADDADPVDLASGTLVS